MKYEVGDVLYDITNKEIGIVIGIFRTHITVNWNETGAIAHSSEFLNRIAIVINIFKGELE